MRRIPFVPNLFLPFVAVLFAGGLAAQEPDSAGARPDTAEVVDLPPLVVTGTGVPVSPEDLGFALSVVTAGELRSEPRLHAADVLRHLPGTFIDESVGPGGPTIVRLRGGEEVFTQILMDGVRMNQNGGFFDFQGLALSNVERVEVARGPQSALYGSSAVSGVVNFITTPGRSGPTRWEFRGEGGGATENGGALRGNVTASGGTEKFRYSAGVGAAYDRGIFEVAHDTRSTDVSLRLDALPSTEWGLNGTFRFVSYDSNLPVRDAGATRVPLDPNQENDRQRWVGSVEARWAPTSRWTHTLRGTLYKEDFFFADRMDEFTPPEGIFVANFNLDFTSDLLRPGVEYRGQVELGESPSAARTAFTYGARWEREELTEVVSGDFESEASFDRNRRAGYAELFTELVPRTSLLAGFRLESFEGLDLEVTPRASAVVDVLPERLSLRGAWGQAYKAPDLRQQFQENPFIRANPEIEPERSDSWEGGADLTLAAGRVSVGVTYFDQDFENLIRNILPEGEERSMNVNIGSSEARGVEWSLRARPRDDVRIGFSGSWIDTEIQDNQGLNPDEFPEGGELPFRPDHTASAFVEVDPLPRLSVRLRASRIASQTVLTERFSGRRVEVDGYTLLDLHGSYRVRESVSLYGRIENLLDTEYVTGFDRPGIPLMGAVGFRVGG